MSFLKAVAQRSLVEHLKDNPCRGLVVGLGPDGSQRQISWIMGRSSSSQNRTYLVHNEIMEAKVADLSQITDSWLIPLIEYTAMRSYNGVHMVTNGNQTDTAIDSVIACKLGTGVSLAVRNGLKTRYCEPDPPIFTSRINGYQNSKTAGIATLSILCAEPSAKAHWISTADAAAKEGVKKENYPGNINAYFDEIDKRAQLDRNRFPTFDEEFCFALSPGEGLMLTTYMPGSKTLPPFIGGPILAPLTGSLEESMQYFWDTLEPEWRVGVGGREITKSTIRYAAPINKHVQKK